MDENGKIVLKWTYTPVDFFEVKETNLLPIYEHTIEGGNITVSMDLSEYISLPGIQEQLRDQLISLFLGAILGIQKPFAIKYVGQEITHINGKTEPNLNIDSSAHAMTAGTLDVVDRDSNGNVIADAKLERLDKLRKLAKLSVKFRKSDPVVDSILTSFEKSLKYPDKQLVHLFEIREALSNRFTGEANAKKELGITNGKWTRLGVLANSEPLNQGRHSGQFIGMLRDATESELKEARDIARNMIIAYLEYLERISSKSP